MSETQTNSTKWMTKRVSVTSYEINREHILKYMKKRPVAVDEAQRKYFKKPEIKEKLKDYNKEYYAWMKYLNNDTFKYQAQLLREINI